MFPGGGNWGQHRVRSAYAYARTAALTKRLSHGTPITTGPMSAAMPTNAMSVAGIDHAPQCLRSVNAVQVEKAATYTTPIIQNHASPVIPKRSKTAGTARATAIAARTITIRAHTNRIHSGDAGMERNAATSYRNPHSGHRTSGMPWRS